MNRDTYKIEQRNKAICEMYYGLIRQGMPFMRAYAETGERFWLSESQAIYGVLLRTMRNKRGGNDVSLQWLSKVES